MMGRGRSGFLVSLPLSPVRVTCFADVVKPPRKTLIFRLMVFDGVANNILGMMRYCCWDGKRDFWFLTVVGGEK